MTSRSERNRTDRRITRSFTQPIARTIQTEKERVLQADTAAKAVGAVRRGDWEKTLTGLWLSPQILDLWGDIQTQFGTDVPFTNDARMLMTRYATEHAVSIVETRRDRIRRIVSEGKADPFDPRRTFRSTNRAALRAAYADVKTQAQRYAFTESLQASETVRYESARAVNDTTSFRMMKVWFTQADARVRRTHSPLNGQSRVMTDPQGKPVRSTFRVGGASLAYPRDPSGPPGEVIHCRCWLEYRKVRKP